MNNEPGINNFFLYAKNLYEAKYQLPINKRESTSLTYLNHSKVFIEYSDDLDDIYKYFEEYNPNKKQKMLIVFDVLSNKKINSIVIE